MAIQIREKDIEEIQERLATMNTALNKINYLESAIKNSGFSFEIKRFILGELSLLYEERKMFDRAAKAMANKAGMEITTKGKIDSYITAAELYARAGRVEEADNMFHIANRDLTGEQRNQVKLARKNVFLTMAQQLEKQGKKASAAKFYEKLLRMKLEEAEKEPIKQKLIETYKGLGMFREARLIEGL